MTEKPKAKLTSAMLLMLLISILLFWLPIFGPLIAGVIGGKKAGGVISAITAVFLPAIIMGAAAFALTTFASGFPMIGMVAALGGLSLAMFNVGPLLLGAVIGGILA
jgi:hypothetical protein